MTGLILLVIYTCAQTTAPDACDGTTAITSTPVMETRMPTECAVAGMQAAAAFGVKGGQYCVMRCERG